MDDEQPERVETCLPPGPLEVDPSVLTDDPVRAWILWGGVCVLLGLLFGGAALTSWSGSGQALIGWGATAFSVLGAWTFGRALLRWSRKRALVAALETDGRAVAVTILRRDASFVPAGTIQRFDLLVPAEEGHRKVREVFQPGSGEPLLLPDGRGVALVTPVVRGACILMREDLWPLALNAERRAVAIECLKGESR